MSWTQELDQWVNHSFEPVLFTEPVDLAGIIPSTKTLHHDFKGTYRNIVLSYWVHLWFLVSVSNSFIEMNNHDSYELLLYWKDLREGCSDYVIFILQRKVFQFWNNLRVSKQWLHFHFKMNYCFKYNNIEMF